MGSYGASCVALLSVHCRGPRGQGIAFARFLSLFLSLFLCQKHYEETAGPICMKFSQKAWSDHGTT